MSTELHDSASARAELDAIADNLRACMQCGTCSASCPNVDFMDFTPRRMWRLMTLGRYDEVLNSKTFWSCSACYTCTLRCPRGLPLTEAVYALKRYAAGNKGKHSAFYRAFLDNVQRNGRVQESTLMARYLAEMRSPSKALGFVPVGLKLMRAGKLHPPGSEYKGVLKPMFDAERNMEDRS